MVPPQPSESEIAHSRLAVARLRSELSRTDRTAGSRYVKALRHEFSRFQTVSSFDDLIVACFKVDLIYVGDFHALPSSQDFAVRLLREVSRRSRRVALAVEMVYGRHQAILDRYMAGGIGDEEFRRRIRYEQEWGYDWEAFRRIFDAAREHSLPVYGIDCPPRSGVRQIATRDRHMAARIADIYSERPDAKVVVIVGESHLATAHLPAEVKSALARRNQERRSVRVLQNLEDVYWGLVERGKEHTDTALVGRNVFCVFNCSPMEKYESYRQTLERWEKDRHEDDELDLTPTIYNMIDTILKFLGVNKFRKTVRRDGEGWSYLVDAYPEVYSSVDVRDLRDLLHGQRFSPSEIREVSAQVQRNGSCYIAGVNAIYIGTFSLVHGGEEAAHFVNHALKGDLLSKSSPPRSRPELFYGAVIEEALGFFGSKLIDPSRNHFFETEFYRYYRKSPDVIEKETGYKYEEFNEIIGFILLHKKFERSYRSYDEIPKDLLKGIGTKDRKRFSVLTHELGYFLGQQIYDGFRSGMIQRAEIADLFGRSLEGSSEALELYLDLSERLPGGIHVSP